MTAFQAGVGLTRPRALLVRYKVAGFCTYSEPTPSTHRRVFDNPSFVDAVERRAYKCFFQLLCASIYEATLGLDHPDTARLLSNLAAQLGNRGCYADEEPLCRRALAVYEATLGLDNSATATCLDNLAELLRRQGCYAEADALERGT